MYKTLRISYSLRNTYRVNSILYALKQIPLVKKMLPDALYQVRGLKLFVTVLSVLWEIIAAFLGKFFYMLLMVYGAGQLYEKAPSGRIFLHILLFLTVIGALMNNNLFNPSKDKYYAMILMRMDARAYTLVNYGYAMVRVMIGFMPFTLIFGRMSGLPIWLCLLIPFSIAGTKLAAAALSLWDYEKRGFACNENRLSKYILAGAVLILGMAYGFPAAGIMLPERIAAALLIMVIPAGLVGLWKIITFKLYREFNKELLIQTMDQMDTVVQIEKEASERAISTDKMITSNRRGFEYLNELFIKRHQKILWKATKNISYGCILLVAGVILLFHFMPESKVRVNEMILTYLPYFVFIMYIINRGTGFTKALFMNCDHSLLTYSFYKQPKMVLKLFKIRLREIIKINSVPAIIIGAGLALLLYLSGGTDNPFNYGILVISILCMSIFFSVHYLTIYYLLQPYNAGTELKSGTYQFVTAATYLVCYFMIKLRMATFVFGIMMIAFCVLYCIGACILIVRFAPKTFKLRA